VNGTRKQTKKEDTNKLTTLAFRMIPILHNTLLATPKLKFYSGAFANFWAHWGILGFRGVKNFGEWYQITNTILKIQITLFAFKIIAIHDNTLLAPANGQKPLSQI
jgi:hypothetical protein